MKKIYTLIASLFLVGVIYAQSELVLKINHKAGDEVLEANTTYTTPDGYPLNFSRLQYYISQIEVTHDGGQVTPMTDVYILANGLESGEFELGSYQIDKVEKISFYIGVDAQSNHSDPALWPAGHALALQIPNMHWGWAAGYRFAAIEGKTGNGMFFTYQIHALGDQHYGQEELDVVGEKSGNTITIALDADYLRMFDGVNVSAGLIDHSDSPTAGRLLRNLQEVVFTSAVSTSNRDQSRFNGAFKVLGNPSDNANIVVDYQLEVGETYKCELVDLNGRIIHSGHISGSGVLQIDEVNKGFYSLNLHDRYGLLAARPVLVR